MKESKFIKQNKEKWQGFENDLKVHDNNPEKISRLFVQITDDLSFSRTYYKNRSVRVYLNGIARILFNKINTNSKENKKNFLIFWQKELPLIVYQSRKEFIISFLVFVISFGIGVLSSINDPDFASTILGDAYVNMTKENIDNNDPMAVYKNKSEFDMFLGITLNNLLVAAKTFVFGIFMSIGTIFIMIYNGVMVGTFQFFFFERGIYSESFLTIWQHGTLEISSIIIAGAAGLTLGKGLLFPGTYGRPQSMRITALRGAKIMTGIAPIIILAAFIEGFFTRYTDMPDIIRLMVILFSLVFILGYFVWYPYKLYRNIDTNAINTEEINFHKSRPIKYNAILSGGELFENTFKFFRKNFKTSIGPILIMAIIYAILATIYKINNVTYFFSANKFSYTLGKIFQTDSGYFIAILHFVLTITFAHIFYSRVLKGISTHNKFEYASTISFVKKQFFQIILCLLVPNYLLFSDSIFGIIVLALALPFFVFLNFICVHNNITIEKGIAEFFTLLKKNFGTFLGLYIKISLIIVAFVALFSTSLIQTLLQGVELNLFLSKKATFFVHYFIHVFIIAISIYITLTLLIYASAMFFSSSNECLHANELIKRISGIKQKKRFFGFEKEQLSEHEI